MNKIIKFLICFFIFSGFIAIYAETVNVIMKDGKLIQAELIGRTEDRIYIKDMEGNAKEIMLKNIKHIFNSKTGEKIEFEVKEKEIMSAGESKPLAKITSSKTLYKIPEQEKYLILGKGVIKPSINIFKRTGKLLHIDFDMLYFDWFPGLGGSISDFGSIKQGDLLDGTLGIRSIGSAATLYLRPFDFIATGPYLRLEWWFSAAVTDKGYTIDLPQMSIGLCTKIILYSELMSGNYENDLYMMIQTGMRGMTNLFDSMEILTPGSQKVKILSGAVAAFDLGFFLGFAIDYFDFKIGYKFCKFTIPAEQIIGEEYLPASYLPLEIDMSGFTTSFGVKIEI